jgi:hypothetical protein
MPSTPTADAAAPKADAPKAARGAKKCPTSFAVTPELRAWAAREAPHVDVDRETAKLRDHTFAAAKVDWPGTWRNWLRTAEESAVKGGQRGRNGRAPDRIDRQLETAGLMVGGAYGPAAGGYPATQPMEVFDVTARAISA